MGLLIAGIFVFTLDATQEDAFYYREMRQLFYLDWDHIRELASPIGGLGMVIAQALIQFFRLPHMGAVITAVIGGLTAWFFWLTAKRICDASYLMPLTFAPTLFQFVSLINNSYHYEGLIALVTASAALCLYALAAMRLGWWLRLLAGVALTIGLFYGFGSAAMLFALTALMFDLCHRSERWYASLLLVLTAFAAGSLAVLGGMRVDYDSVMWMKDYLELTEPLTHRMAASWYAAILLLPLFRLARHMSRLHPIAKPLIGLALIGGICYHYHDCSQDPSIRNPQSYTGMRIYHYVDTEQWDELLKCKDISPYNYTHLNCRNLALAAKGQLADDLFRYPQAGGHLSLITKDEGFVDLIFLQSLIYYQAHITSLAYNNAFGASISITYGSPTMTKIIIKSHLIYGRYALADKYISLLEKTWAYREWATSMRRFLYNDEAVEADPELGVRRRSLTDNQHAFSDFIGFASNFFLQLDANPADKASRDYLIAYLLLEKDMANVRYFVERYAGTEVLAEVPAVLQQAIVSYAENDSDYCRAHGVSDKIMSDFDDFRKRVLNARHSNKDVTSSIAGYRGTFWYYLLTAQ